jgi:hypothetical protein
VQTTTAAPKITATADGAGIVSHAGGRLLADLAAVTGLAMAYSAALAGQRRRLAGPDAGRVLADLAVMIASGGECISDLAVLRHQPRLFGRVASTATAWRVLERIDDVGLAALRAARAAARERAWAQREETGRPLPAAMAGGRKLPGLVIGIDATLVTAHSEKEHATPTFEGGFGFHPILAYLDNTHEALAGMLRPGKAGANTAADHITVTDAALAQLPEHVRAGTPILFRTDGAGCTKAWLPHLRRLREENTLQVEFSTGFTMTEPVQHAILALPEAAWTPAVEADGDVRDGADVAELARVLPSRLLTGYPAGMRVIVRRERPHPGAQLTFTEVDGWRFPAFATDTPTGQLAHLVTRHRAHARVEDRIRCGQDTGIARFPSRHYPINAAWLELSLAAADLLAWTQTMLLDGTLAKAEPKALRYRLLHVAALITRGQRRTFLRIDAHWPWRRELAAAFARLQAIPEPST